MGNGDKLLISSVCWNYSLYSSNCYDYISVDKKRIKHNIIPLFLSYNFYEVLGMISVGRAGFGLEGSLATSRYSTYSLLAFLGTFLLIFNDLLIFNEMILPRINKKQVICKYSFLACSAVIIILFNQSMVGLIKGIQAHHHKEYLTNVLFNYKLQPLENLQKIYPFESYSEAYYAIRILERNQLNVFKDLPYNYYEKIPVDLLQDTTKVDSEIPIGFSKNDIMLDYDFLWINNTWGADFITNQSYKDIFVKLNGDLYNTKNHISRTDAPDHFDNPNFKNTGFEFDIPRAELKESNNEISIIVVCNDESSYTQTQPIYFDAINRLTGEKIVSKPIIQQPFYTSPTELFEFES